MLEAVLGGYEVVVETGHEMDGDIDQVVVRHVVNGRFGPAGERAYARCASEAPGYAREA